MNIFRNIKFFYNWYNKNFISPAPIFVKHKIIKHFLIKDSIFIETGTGEGRTLIKLAKNFSFCYIDFKIFNNKKRIYFFFLR